MAKEVRSSEGDFSHRAKDSTSDKAKDKILFQLIFFRVFLTVFQYQYFNNSKKGWMVQQKNKIEMKQRVKNICRDIQGGGSKKSKCQSKL